MESIKNNKWQRMQMILNQHSTIHSNTINKFRTLQINRFISENILVFLLQFIGLTLSTLSSPPAPLWLASGTACAFIFLRGYHVLFGIGLGSFCAYLASHTGLILSSLCALLWMGQNFLLLFLCYRLEIPTLLFYHRILFVKFFVCAAVITSFTSFLFSFILHTHWLSNEIGNLGGIFAFAIPLIIWDAYFPDIHKLKQLNKSVLISYYFIFMLNIVGMFIRNHTTLFALGTLIFLIGINRKYGWLGTMGCLFLAGLLINLIPLL